MFFRPSFRLALSLLLFLLISHTSSLIYTASSSDEIVQQLLSAEQEEERLAILQQNKALLNREHIANLLSSGDKLRLSFELDKALIAYNLAEMISDEINDPAGKAKALIGKGRLHGIRSEFEEAMKYYEQARDLSESANDLAGKANAMRLIAGILAVWGKQDEELKLLQESLKIEESIQNKEGIGISFYWFGVDYLEKGEQELGFQYFQKSLALSKETGDVITEAAANNSLGVYYDYRGNYDLALKYYKNAEELNRNYGNLIGLSNSLHNIATLYYQKGNFISALQYHLESLKLREKAGGKRAIAITLSEMATVYAEQGQFNLALEYLKKSYDSFVATKDHFYSARTLSDMGIVYGLADETDKAISCFDQALPDIRKFGEEGDASSTLNAMGRAYASKNQHEKALQSYQDGLTALSKEPKLFVRAVILQNIVWSQIALGNHNEALRNAEELIALARKHELHEILWTALLASGKSEASLQRPEKAQAALEESIRILESRREEVAGGEGERERYFESRIEPYAELIQLFVNEKNNTRAFEYAERAKARVLLDVLQEGRQDLARSLTLQEKEQENKLKENLHFLNVQFRESVESTDTKEKNAAKSKLDQARLEYEEFQTKLYALHPEVKVQRGEAEIVNVAKAQDILPERSAFLEYVVSKDKTFLFFLTASEIEVYEVSANEEVLKETVSAFRNKVSKRNPGFRDVSKQLHNLLISPVQSDLVEIDHVVIIPDGILWDLPFQALLNEDGRFFLEDISISYAPSITALSEMEKAKRSRSKDPTVLAFANPDFGKEAAEKVQMIFRGTQLHPLPEAEAEVKKLAELYGSDRASVYVGSNAKESVLKKEIEKHGVVHLATHGILNETSPMYSHLLFSRSENDAEDGLLEAWEIMNMNLQAGLVILSACETARGRVGAGEGVIGLNWAFFVAGCPTTVVSQWKVESASTADLMFQFHQNLKDGKTSTQALRNAALSILKNPKYRHPFYWASFIVVGDPS